MSPGLGKLLCVASRSSATGLPGEFFSTYACKQRVDKPQKTLEKRRNLIVETSKPKLCGKAEISDDGRRTHLLCLPTNHCTHSSAALDGGRAPRLPWSGLSGNPLTRTVCLDSRRIRSGPCRWRTWTTMCRSVAVAESASCARLTVLDSPLPHRSRDQKACSRKPHRASSGHRSRRWCLASAVPVQGLQP